MTQTGAVRFRWRVAFACLLVIGMTGGATVPCAAERVVTKFDADQVDFSFDRRLVTLRGNARVFSQVVDDPSKFVRIEADLIEGDISRGRFEMLDGVHIVTPRGAMRGDSAYYDARTAQYSLRRGGIMVPIGEGEDDDDVTCGFAYAREIATEDEIVYITNGRFTTCSRVDPHYSLRADRFRWNPETEQVVVYGGSIRIYGLNIPVLPKLPYSFGRSDDDMPSVWPFPTYSSRDGLRLGWSFAIGDPMGNPRTAVNVRWRQIRPLQMSSRTVYDLDDSTKLWLRLGLREDMRQDIDRIVPVDRFPELGAEGEWDIFGGDYQLEAALSAGHYKQRREERLDPVEEDRLKLQTRLTGNPEGIYEPGETWWWVDAAGALYSDGNHYAALGAGLGGAARLTDWFAGNVEVKQWATGGQTPFVWDDVDLKTEIETNVQIRATDRWRMRFGGRYDLSGGELRAWEAQLRRREHCLTWKIGYSDISDNFMVGAEINGLFGNDEPPEDPCPEDGPPDFWAHHGGANDQGASAETPVGEASETQTDADTASEAMERP